MDWPLRLTSCQTSSRGADGFLHHSSSQSCVMVACFLTCIPLSTKKTLGQWLVLFVLLLLFIFKTPVPSLVAGFKHGLNVECFVGYQFLSEEKTLCINQQWSNGLWLLHLVYQGQRSFPYRQMANARLAGYRVSVETSQLYLCQTKQP